MSKRKPTAPVKPFNDRLDLETHIIQLQGVMRTLHSLVVDTAFHKKPDWYDDTVEGLVTETRDAVNRVAQTFYHRADGGAR